MIVGLAASATHSSTPVDVEVLTGDEGGTFEVEDPFDDVVNFADTAEGVECYEGFVAFWVVHGGLGVAKGDHVYAHATRGVFYG
jgi:hypothetical protein